jgi:23S rRNA (adenine2503-C2)-methyltransferase
MSLTLNGLGAGELERAVAPHGVPADVARRLFARVHERGAPSEPHRGAVRGLSLRAAAALDAAGARARRIEVVSRRRSSADGFVKYLFRLHDGALVESVLIPLPAGPDTTPDKHTLCISSQAGCPLACAFCATGRLGLVRSLEAWEIVDQVARIRDETPAPVRGLVFMGMGEPFMNYDAVLRAAEIISDPAGFAIAKKAITISTAGIVPAIRRYTAEGHRYRLAISLTSAIEAKRRWLMPIEQKYPLTELLDAARAHATATRARIMLEYVLISGVNVGREDAEALIERLAGLEVRLNLIDVNDATGRFAPPSAAELRRFRDWLAPLGQPIVRRYSGGKDVEGACGMLAAERLVRHRVAVPERPAGV